MNSFSSVTVTLPVRFHIPILQRPMVMYGKVCREKGPGRRGTAHTVSETAETVSFAVSALHCRLPPSNRTLAPFHIQLVVSHVVVFLLDFHFAVTPHARAHSFCAYRTGCCHRVLEVVYRVSSRSLPSSSSLSSPSSGSSATPSPASPKKLVGWKKRSSAAIASASGVAWNSAA
jgi:hypothetical protein